MDRASTSLYSEEYTFTTLSDDGVRLWVNGVKFIDNWTSHGSILNEGKIKLNAGQKYEIKLEYFNNTGDAIIKLSWSSQSQNKQAIPQSQLFGMATDSEAPTVPTGLKVVTVYMTQVNLHWNESTDYFKVVGYKVFRGGVQIGTVGKSTTYIDTGLTANTTYLYTVSAYDAAGNNSEQSQQVSVVTIAALGNGLRGDYFDNMDLTNQKLTRIDSKIDFNWGTSPLNICLEGIPFLFDGLVKYFHFIQRNIPSHTLSDDGVRLWVNGVILIDNWTSHSGAKNEGKIKLNAGQKYEIKLSILTIPEMQQLSCHGLP